MPVWVIVIDRLLRHVVSMLSTSVVSRLVLACAPNALSSALHAVTITCRKPPRILL